MEASKIRRIRRTRAKINGTAERPRLSVYRSNKQIFAQLIDDVNGKTLIGATSFEIKEKKSPTELAQLTGVNLAKKAIAKKINTAVFDRRGYQYHGRVKALAEGAREGGLKI